MKKVWITLLALVLFVLGACPVFAATDPPQLIGETAIVVDMKTGEILMEKNMHQQRYPASTTKIMTAILTLEHLKLDQVVTVDEQTPYEIEGSHIALEPGEQLTVEQLLYGLMLPSGNDCATVLGKTIAGSTESFAQMMNEKAKELGALNTNFVNANGLHDPQHMSTAYDLALMARYAMTDETIGETFRTIVSTYRYDIPVTNKKTEARVLYNTNRMLYDEKTKIYVGNERRGCKYEGITGIKTGYTSHAGGCLVSSARRGDSEFLCVTLKSTDLGRFSDSIALLDWAFANYRTVSGMTAGTSVGQIPVKKGAFNKIGVVLAEDIFATIPATAEDSAISTKVVLDESVQAPVQAGQAVGKVQVYEGDRLVAEYDAVAAGEVPEGGVLSNFGIEDAVAKKIYMFFAVCFILLAVLISTYIELKRRQIRRRRARREERRRRMAEAEAKKRTAWEEKYERRYQNRYK